MAENQVETLVEQLRDFRSRSAAIRALVAAGDAAVAPLVKALKTESHEGARWAVLRCLGELRARCAVVDVVALLDDPSYRTAAHQALVRIVGEDLGPAPEPWIRRAEATGAAGEAPEAEMHMIGLDDARLVELAVRDSGASVHAEREGHVVVEMASGQKVMVDLTRRDHEGSSVVIVYADCGPAGPERYERALRQNLRMPYGALAVRDREGVPCFVMFNTLLRDALSPLELKKSILTVGDRAARVRREMGG